MNNLITLTGKVIFDPVNLTTKHKKQSGWKKIAFIEFEGDLCEYYAWFLMKRYNLILNKSVRAAHISVVNDSINDLSLNGELSNEEINKKWNNIKDKYNNKEIEVIIDLDVRTNGNHWYLNVPHDLNKPLIDIRCDLGLGDPYYKLHMSVGYPHPLHIEHSEYIHDMIVKELITT